MKRISIFALSLFMAGAFFGLPLRAEETVTTNADVPFSAEEITCIKEAITVRDAALKEAYNVYSEAVKTALSARTTALLAAWDKGTVSEIKTALADAWKTYKRSHVMARITLRKAKVSTWKGFRTARETCLGESTSGIDASDMKSDAQL